MGDGYWNNAMGSTGFFFMFFMMLIFWGGLIWLLAVYLRRHDHPHLGHPHTPESNRASGALRILDERLARGEIEIEEYQRRRALLQ